MFKIIFEKYFEEFEKQIKDNHFSLELPKSETPIYTTDAFSFYTSLASVYSSKIESEDIDLDSFIKHKFLNVKYKRSYISNTDNLHKAYVFARKKPLNTENLLKAHALMTKNFLIKTQQGKVRVVVMQVKDEIGRILYVGTDPANVHRELGKLLDFIEYLLSENLSVAQCFYFASVIHLLLLNIHPFMTETGALHA